MNEEKDIETARKIVERANRIKKLELHSDFRIKTGYKDDLIMKMVDTILELDKRIKKLEKKVKK